VKKGDGKAWKVESFESAFGYGGFYRNKEEVPADLTDTLLAALEVWGNSSDDCEKATAGCLAFVDHVDPRVRAVAVSAIGKLIPKITHAQSDAIATLSQALSDSDRIVKESAQHAVQLLYQESGITVKPPSA
jgi:hypothetical protein